jgi:disulfide bond formation protein DsbB
MAGALGSQYIGGLYPCEMCHWQRWPHYAAIVIALAAFATAARPPTNRRLVIVAALCILASGLIGAFHAGVEYGWWEGLTQCSRMPSPGKGDMLADIMATPLIRCDVAQWTLFGISLAGWNALFSIAGGATILALCLKRPR